MNDIYMEINRIEQQLANLGIRFKTCASGEVSSLAQQFSALLAERNVLVQRAL